MQWMNLKNWGIRMKVLLYGYGLMGKKVAHQLREKDEFDLIGVVSYELTDKMKSGREFCRSLYVAEDMKVGDIITEENVRSVRPGYGLHPKYLKEILGKKNRLDLMKGEAFRLDYVDGFLNYHV